MGAGDDIVRELSGCRTPISSRSEGFYAQMLIPAPRSPRSGTLAISMIRNKKRRTAIVRPLAIGLIGLALAVVLWGIGYRMSLYRSHPDPSVRMGVAKLWVGSRRAVCVSNARTRLVAVTLILNFYMTRTALLLVTRTPSSSLPPGQLRASDFVYCCARSARLLLGYP